MSKTKSNVHPGNYKVAGRERQGEEVIHDREKALLTQNWAALEPEAPNPGWPARPGDSEVELQSEAEQEEAMPDEGDPRARAPRRGGREIAVHPGRRVRSGGDPPRTRGQARGALDQAGDRDRALQGAPGGREARRPEDGLEARAPAGGARCRQGAKSAAAALGEAVPRGNRCPEARRTGRGFAPRARPSGPIERPSARSGPPLGGRPQGGTNAQPRLNQALLLRDDSRPAGVANPVDCDRCADLARRQRSSPARRRCPVMCLVTSRIALRRRGAAAAPATPARSIRDGRIRFKTNLTALASCRRRHTSPRNGIDYRERVAYRAQDDPNRR